MTWVNAPKTFDKDNRRKELEMFVWGKKKYNGLEALWLFFRLNI